MTAIDFDLDRYLRASKRLDLSQIAWDQIPRHPLDDGAVMSMEYMMDIETHTVIYLRDLLATRAANDPQITAFLACWVYEELWHGEAFSDFLRAYGIEVPGEAKLPDGRTPLPTRSSRTSRLREELGVGHRLSLLPTMLGSMAFRDFIALHMTWGAINELTTLTGYHALIRRCPHPVLHEMLRRVIQDERRHFAFYRAQAKARLERAPRRTRRLVQVDPRALLDAGGRGRQVPGGGGRARPLPVRLGRRGPRDGARAGRHRRRDPGTRGPAAAGGGARRGARARSRASRLGGRRPRAGAGPAAARCPAGLIRPIRWAILTPTCGTAVPA